MLNLSRCPAFPLSHASTVKMWFGLLANTKLVVLRQALPIPAGWLLARIADEQISGDRR